MTNKKNKYIHVIPHDTRWAIRREGENRLISVYDTKLEAENIARKLARDAEGELVIHGGDGRIRSRDSYSSDPLPPKSPREVLYPATSSTTSKREIRNAVRKVIEETREQNQP